MGTFKTLLETGTDMLRSFNGTEPQVADSAYVDETAVVIGDVVIEDEASVWPNTTLRGDHGTIVVGEGANVQDNAVLHETAELEPYSTVGHSAIVHDATVAERALVGMNAVVLDGAHVGEGGRRRRQRRHGGHRNPVVDAGRRCARGTENRDRRSGTRGDCRPIRRTLERTRGNVPPSRLTARRDTENESQPIAQSSRVQAFIDVQ